MKAIGDIINEALSNITILELKELVDVLEDHYKPIEIKFQKYKKAKKKHINVNNYQYRPARLFCIRNNL